MKNYVNGQKFVSDGAWPPLYPGSEDPATGKDWTAVSEVKNVGSERKTTDSRLILPGLSESLNGCMADATASLRVEDVPK